jgi:hypothetical protein
MKTLALIASLLFLCMPAGLAQNKEVRDSHGSLVETWRQRGSITEIRDRHGALLETRTQRGDAIDVRDRNGRLIGTEKVGK